MTTLNEQQQRVPDPFDTVQNTDLRPRYPQPVAQQSGAAAQTPAVAIMAKKFQVARLALKAASPALSRPEPAMVMN